MLLSIQYLRAVAALGVVGFHQVQQLLLFRLGEHGVDLFFVISGFIMIVLTDRRPVTPGRFVLERLCRIVPTYWFATLATAALAGLGLSSANVASPGGWHLLQSMAFIPAVNATGHTWPTLFLGWTLNFEMFFYALFAAALCFRPAVRLPILAVLLLGLTALGVLRPESGPLVIFYTNPLLCEFLAGAALGSVFGIGLHAHRLWPTIGMGLSVAAALLALSVVIPSLVFGAGAVAMVLGLLLLERAGSLPRVPFLLTIGNASYSIYLSQQIAFDLIGAATGFDQDVHAHLVQALTYKGLAMAAAVALGLAMHAWVEVPLTRLVRRLVSNAAHVPAALAPSTEIEVDGDELRQEDQREPGGDEGQAEQAVPQRL